MNEADALTELSAAGLVPGQRTRKSSCERAQRRCHQHQPGRRCPGGPRFIGGLRGLARPGRHPHACPHARTTPAPTPTTGPATLPGDLLERIQAAGQIVVNVDVGDAPWSSKSNDGTFHGYDVDIAKRIAKALGVDIVFTSYPLEQVVTGDWGGRFDIAMQHLAITDQRRQVLDFSAPYAFDPAQLIATTVSGRVRRRVRQGQPICAAIGSSAQDWVDGTLRSHRPARRARTGARRADHHARPPTRTCACLARTARRPRWGRSCRCHTASKAIAAGAPFVLVGDPGLLRSRRVSRPTGPGRTRRHWWPRWTPSSAPCGMTAR